MNKSEFIKSNESQPQPVEETIQISGVLTLEAVDELYLQRTSNLEGIKALLSLKLYHRIAEKLEKEKIMLMKFLRWEDTKQDILSNYTFVLNTQYFEQKFLGN